MNRRAALMFAAFMAGIPFSMAQAKTAPAPHWVPVWYASPEPVGPVDKKLENTTLRQIVRVSAAGNTIRLRVSNAYGTDPLHIDAIRVANRLAGSRIDVTTDTTVTFSGHDGVTLAPGAWVLSDPISLTVAAQGDVAVSLYVSTPTPLTTEHDNQRGALYVATGNLTRAADLPVAPVDIGIGSGCPWLAEVEVSGTPAKSAVVAFGDSITDGYGITPDTGGTWPQILGQRFNDAHIPLSVVNAGISGNRLLHNGQWIRFGDAALARFDRDVLAQPNVSATIVLIGINDLGHSKGPGAPEYVSGQDIIDGLTQIAERAHERGIRVYAATLTPFKGTVFTDYYSDEKETQRLLINAWIRQSKLFDGVIDFDAAVVAPDAPGHMRPDLELSDHLHPNDAGARVMADAVPLRLFSWAKLNGAKR